MLLPLLPDRDRGVIYFASQEYPRHLLKPGYVFAHHRCIKNGPHAAVRPIEDFCLRSDQTSDIPENSFLGRCECCHHHTVVL